MSRVLEELKYTKSHEWVRQEQDGSVTVGITDHAQELLGDMVYVELPEVQSKVKVFSETGVVESVKAASDVYSPVSGTITAVNEEVSKNPAIVNQDPYGKGWLFKLNPSNAAELSELLSASAYTAQINADEA